MVLGLWGAVIVGVSIIVGVGSALIFKKRDGSLEQLAEQVFEHQTGIEVDFSPEEKKKLEKRLKKKVGKIYKG